MAKKQEKKVEPTADVEVKGQGYACRQCGGSDCTVLAALPPAQCHGEREGKPFTLVCRTRVQCPCGQVGILTEYR